MAEEISGTLHVGARCTQGCCRANTLIATKRGSEMQIWYEGQLLCKLSSSLIPCRTSMEAGCHCISLQTPGLSLPGLMPGLSPSPSRQREAEWAPSAVRRAGMGRRDRPDLAACSGTTAKLLRGGKLIHCTRHGLCKLSPVAQAAKLGVCV